MVPGHYLETTAEFDELFQGVKVLPEGPPAKTKPDPIAAAKCVVREDNFEDSRRFVSQLAVATGVGGVKTALGVWFSHSCSGD